MTTTLKHETMKPVQAFLCNYLPRSVQAKNKKHKALYYKSLVDAYRKYHANTVPSEKYLYGKVYYFHRTKNQIDADNLSKPVWDALEGEAYNDDYQIRFRTAGLFFLGVERIEELDLTYLPEYLIDDFLEMINSDNKHIIYVEFGDFSYDLIRFGDE